MPKSPRTFSTSLFLRELRVEAKGLLLWTLSLGALIFWGMSEYSFMGTDMGDLSSFMEAMPRVLLAVFGFSDLDLSTAQGYHGILMNYVVLGGVIYAAMLGSRLVAKEELGKTSEFLLVKPRSRKNLLATKLLAGMLLLLLLSLILYGISRYTLWFYVPEAQVTRILSIESLGLFLLMLLYLALGIFSASALKKPRQAQGLTLGAVFFAYALSVFTDLLEEPGLLRLLTPLRYFPMAEVVDTAKLPLLYALLTLIFAGALLALAFKTYTQRDMSI
ncbi:ABC transporter permease subunit [Proteiniclasticum sp. BAD-10]|uniref:ABC transporter permease subunit n=1 Tax=Proteiniclasticum sediminis TaxID=2804028 RepID=A0A941HS91_9CLOT|nr:ABC transporter permease subunit [Proteiniclasticum sediminis]MBR0577017.1 ABC transporter permease subunit [Proteiniclasticum sediminis]